MIHTMHNSNFSAAYFSYIAIHINHSCAVFIKTAFLMGFFLVHPNFQEIAHAYRSPFIAVWEQLP